MAATPITAKSAINKRGVAMMEDTRTAKEKFAAVTSTEFLHPEKYANHLVAYTKDPVIQAQIRESIQVCTLDVNGFIEEWNGKGPDYRGFAEQAIRLYHRVLMSVIDSECSRFRRVSIPLLLRDEAFRHCLLACAGEMIRHVFEIRFFNFENLLTSLHVRKLDLVMMIDLVLKGLGGWLPKMAIKRLAGISERFLEMEIWDERDLFVLMNAAKQQQQGGRDVATCSFQTSAMNLLYDEVNMPAQMYGKNVNLDEINHNHVPRLAKVNEG